MTGTTDAAERLSHAVAIAGVLWPGSQVRFPATGPRTTDPRHRFTVVPATAHPRLLVPAGPSSASSAALRAYGGRLTRRGRWGYRTIATAGRFGMLRALPGRLDVHVADSGLDGVDDALGALLGRRVAVAIHLTPARTNRKPVLPVLAAGASTPVGFAKAAVTAVSRGLVEHEASTLGALGESPPDGLTLPRALGLVDVGDARVLLLDALPTWAPGRLPTRDEVDAAALALIRSRPRSVDSVADSAYWSRLLTAAETVTGAAGGPLLAAVEAVASSLRGLEMDFGACHGDWSPWNMWRTKRHLLVWDWERFADKAPVGSDLVHFAVQDMVHVRRMPPAVAAQRVVAEAGDVLRAVTPDARQAEATALLHLLSLAVRYESEGSSTTGSALGHTASWLLPAVCEGAARWPGAGS